MDRDVEARASTAHHAPQPAGAGGPSAFGGVAVGATVAAGRLVLDRMLTRSLADAADDPESSNGATIAAQAPRAGPVSPAARAAAEPADLSGKYETSFVEAPESSGRQVVVDAMRRSSLSALLRDEHTSGVVIDYDPAKLGQEMWGYGAALTESTVSNIDRLTPSQRRDLMRKLFTQDGANFSVLRVPIGGNDFSRHDYSLDDTPDNAPDPSLAQYDFGPDEKFASFLREVKRYQPGLKTMLTSWSPPAWMKQRLTLRGSELNPAFYEAFAAYLVRTIKEYQARGVDIDLITMQNEPYIIQSMSDSKTREDFKTRDWYFQHMDLPAETAGIILSKYLMPMILADRSIHTKVLVHDHNWGLQKMSAPLLDNPDYRSVLGGVAFHCYGGYLADMQKFAEAYPGVPIIQTECTAELKTDTNADGFHWWMHNESSDATRIGSLGALAWNLALDADGGPVNPGGCDGCRGVVTIERSAPKGADTKGLARPVAGASVTYNLEYDALAQVSRFVRPGARRIDSNDSSASGVSNSVFLNPDSTVVIVARNAMDEPATITLRNVATGQSIHDTIPARGATTYVLPKIASKPAPHEQ